MANQDPPASGSAAASPSASQSASASELIRSLREASVKSAVNPKPLIRSTEHKVSRRDKGKYKQDDDYTITSWKTAEFAYRKAATVGVGQDLPTLARGLFTVAEGDGSERILVRGYDKFFNVGEMGWTKPASIERYSCPPYALTFKENGCIIFIAALSPDRILVTSKHALDSKRAAGGEAVGADAEEVDEIQASVDASPSTSAAAAADRKVTHAGKGEEWLEKHLARVGRTKSELAAELWKRQETAVAELCDDSFEEHVLAYPPEKSGLHLHGLNSNTVDFHTRSMDEVEVFAREWGMIPTRYLTLGSMAEVQEFTDRVGTTGEWQGEAIEGFVVRTRIPRDALPADTKEQGVAAPPYAPNQVWFYKVKYDEPYLMYRDWRELAKKMVGEKTKWEKENSKASSKQRADVKAEHPSQVTLPALEELSLVDAQGEPKSKSQIKREKKARGLEIARRKAAEAASRESAGPQLARPDPPRARSNRPETRLFIEWCYAKIWGSADGKVKPDMKLFQGLNFGKGIIHLRDTFLRYLETREGRSRLQTFGGPRGALAARLGGQEAGEAPLLDTKQPTRPFTHLLVVPVAIPGCGKTSLFVALQSLFPDIIGHTQSDDVKAKKSAPGFLKNICEELSKHRIVLADRNNHLLKHRDEIVEAVRAWEERGGRSEETLRAEKKALHRAKQNGVSAGVADEKNAADIKPRVKIVALSWSLDLLALNTLHRLMADRIVVRGSNHQSLVADTTSAVGSRSHETILWRFLESLQTLGHAEGKGEGDQGRGDASLDCVVRLNVERSQEEQLKVVCDEVITKEAQDIVQLAAPTEEQMRAALDAARQYKVAVPGSIEQQNSSIKKGAESKRTPRYYGLAVELDLSAVIPEMLSSRGDESSLKASEMVDALRSRNRINPKPHITLVHSSNLVLKEGQEEDAKAKETVEAVRRRWNRYTELVAQGGTVDFLIELGNLVYNERVMAFSIQKVTPEVEEPLSTRDFWDLQGGRGDSTHANSQQGAWHPHITVGTMDESIRPFEANALVVVAQADPNAAIGVVENTASLVVRARLMGLN